MQKISISFYNSVAKYFVNLKNNPVEFPQIPESRLLGSFRAFRAFKFFEVILILLGAILL